MKTRAQGTMEYLIMIAVVIAGSLFIIALLQQIFQNTGELNQQPLKEEWQNEKPFAIMEWTRSGTTLTLIIKNNSFQTLDIQKVQITQLDSNNIISGGISPGEIITKTISIANGEDCVNGAKYSFSKNYIQIDYNSTPNTTKTQQANSDIAGKCN